MQPSPARIPSQSLNTDFRTRRPRVRLTFTILAITSFPNTELAGVSPRCPQSFLLRLLIRHILPLRDCPTSSVAPPSRNKHGCFSLSHSLPSASAGRTHEAEVRPSRREDWQRFHRLRRQGQVGPEAPSLHLRLSTPRPTGTLRRVPPKARSVTAWAHGTESSRLRLPQ